MTVNIICGDSAATMRDLAVKGVRAELSVTSPPYDRLREYGGFVWDFKATAHALYDVMVDGGIVCWNVGDSVVNGCETLTSCEQKIYFVREVGFRVHDTMFYAKKNFSHPERARYHQVVEYVFILSKGAPRCFNPIKDKPNKSAGDPGSFGANTYAKPDGSRGIRKKQTIAEFGMRTNLWTGNTRGQEEFGRKLPQTGMMPIWLARDLITSWSNPGDTVIDPHSGWGTTGLEAAKLNRHAILIEQRRESARGSSEHISKHVPAVPVACLEA